MVDGSLMLAPVAAAWLLEDERGRTHSAEFLARTDGRRGEAARALGADLVGNLRFVLQASAKVALAPRPANLIALKPGLSVDQWRNSNTGLGGGRYPYDVNAVFVPAALETTSRFFLSGLLEPYLEPADQLIFARAEAPLRIWHDKAGPLFDVTVPSADGRRDITHYAATLNVSSDAALRSVGDSPVRFHALSLDANGNTIAVVHSDEGFDMLFGRPSPRALRQVATTLMRPFPAGLLTDVGIVVANPVFASSVVQAELTSRAYHGTVIWSWQQPVMTAGLQRQLQRPELHPNVKEELRAAQRQLWGTIRASHIMRNSELWSWTFAGGTIASHPSAPTLPMPTSPARRNCGARSTLRYPIRAWI